jgi:hypothetical protein
MSTHLLPKNPHDLTLAPVAITVDRNLAFLRASSVDQMAGNIELDLDRPERNGTRLERADRVLAVAVRNVDLHGWEAAVTPDNARIRLSGGSVTLDLGLSSTILSFIEQEG